MPTSSRADRQALVALRILAATMLLIHGSYRAFTGGVPGFGEFLASHHLPAAVAYLITAMEIGGSLLLASGRRVRLLSLYFAAELSAGVVLVHASEGWFVVGGGRNGVEYSVVLVSIFLALAWSAGGRDEWR